MHFVSKFLSDERGAITIDFVVLVAAISTLGLVIVVTISGGVEDVSDYIVEFLANVPTP